MSRALFAILAAASYATAQTDGGLELLGRVRQHVEAGIAALPNYTCQERMERSVYAPGGQIAFRESLRLEVLFADQGELFAWPGSSEFTRKPLGTWIRAGAIGTGSFAVELHNLFVASSAKVEYAGLESRDGRAVYRFDFYAPLLESKRILTINGVTAATAYSGSIWMDKDSLDPVRLETRAEEIPPNLDCRNESESVTYGRVRLGVSDRLLPSSAELTMIARDGRRSHNSVSFDNCRRYAAEASVSFDDAALERPAASSAAPQLQLPPGIALDLRLDQPISIAEAAAGDPVTAELDKAVRSGDVSLPKGARVFGRIRRLEQHFGSPDWYLVGLEFFAVESPRGRVLFSARLRGPQPGPDVIVPLPMGGRQTLPSSSGLDIEDDSASTGIGTLRIIGDRLRLPRGFRTVWETQTISADAAN